MLPDSIEFIPIDDARYPPLLRQISDPPKGLYVRGNLQDTPCVSIVGTRRCTPYGRRATHEIVADLVVAGLGVVSGLALGIDGEAHKAALEAGGYTVAILGTGIDEATIYPREHLKLAHDILESGGALVSEFPPGSGSFKHVFPRRNRLIAGWTPATIVVEASIGSGSLITAKLALDDNREVLAVPGSIWSEVSQGSNRLLTLGAKVCTNATDVLDVLQLDRPELVSQVRASMPLTAEESTILGLITGHIHVDDLSTQAGLDAATTSAHLSLLEMKGYVAQLGGQFWSRTSSRLRK
ncbi:DNA-processing protein DprA [Candidatus Uhrbacteria bacterium]|nr:DNA-processing protein DprA [Candidatus Uhrbacteria bacterium]